MELERKSGAKLGGGTLKPPAPNVTASQFSIVHWVNCANAIVARAR